MRQLIILDGDDTLWSTQPLFDQASHDIAEFLTDSGVETTNWHEVLTEMDVANVQSLGFSPDRFPRSCVDAYAELCRQQGLSVEPDLSERVKLRALTVHEMPAVVLPGVPETLKELTVPAAVVLLTKGDEAVQRTRISQSGLDGYFDATFIVESKTADVIAGVVETMGFYPANSWMVGNSFQSDIAPALECGCNAVWVEADVWRYEKQLAPYEHPRMHEAERFSDLLQLAPLLEALGLKKLD